MRAKESKVEEQGEFKHVYLVKYLKDDGEEAEMRVEALDDNDAKMMMLKRKGVDKVTAVKKIAESKVDEALSRKYYIRFADMLKRMEDRETAKKMASEMAEMFRVDNPRFDTSRFMAAADVVVAESEVEEEVADEKCGKKHMEEVEEEVTDAEVDLQHTLDRSKEEEVEESDEKMMPGQKPYTDEEKKKRDRLVADAAEGDPGEANEGKDEPGKRDGTGPFQGKEGKRKAAGEKCPNEEEVEESDESMDEEKDPKAEVRNRGNAVFQSTHEKVRDDKDHFPINSENQARNALARAAQYESSPAWYDGTLESLQASVKRAVKSAYPSIEVAEKKVEEEATEKAVVESVDPAFELAQDLLGLNESADTMDEIQEGTEVTILSNRDMQVIYECVKVAKITESAVEVTGNGAEVDQEWYRFDMCQIYPV